MEPGVRAILVNKGAKLTIFTVCKKCLHRVIGNTATPYTKYTQIITRLPQATYSLVLPPGHSIR